MGSYAFLFDRYKRPFYVTECGLSCNDHMFLDGQIHDTDRSDFLHRYLLALRNGSERADIRGFFHWSLTDNFEWHSGYGERFGLIYIDYPTQRRIVKDSARWYAQTARENGRNPELFFVYSGAVSAPLVSCSDLGCILPTPNAPGRRGFLRCAASFFLEIRQYSCGKMSCSAREFLAAGHIFSFQIHPKP